MSETISSTPGIIIGSRGSDLALAQSRYVAGRLRSLPIFEGDIAVDIEIIQTRGDRILDVPLAQVGAQADSEPKGGAGTTAIDRKGVFTKELEDALLEKRVDLAVHSYKDLPSIMPEGLCIAAIPERVDAEDSILFLREGLASEAAPFITNENASETTHAKPRLRIGTSSVRRTALLKHHWPHLECIDLRGNVPTRIKKLFLDPNDPARPDAILLARAGIERLRAAGFFEANPEMQALLDRLEIRPLPVDLFPPAPAQGALAIQCREDDLRIRGILAHLHDPQLEACLEVERGILKALEGGCHLPLGAHCRLESSNREESEQDSSQNPEADEDSDELTAYVFLGGEAEDNRSGRSFSIRRYGAGAAELRDSIIREIKSQVPLVITGKVDRLEELRARHSQLELTTLPLLSTVESFSEDSRVGKDFDNWIMGQSPGARRLLAVFSTAGVHALANLIRETGHSLDGVEWGVVGQKTADALRDALGAEADLLSPDGTGAGLANLVAEQQPRFDAILALTAEKGREDFYEILFDHGIATLKLSLYRTETRVPEAAEYARLPRRAKLVFGSPSAATAFLTGLERALPDARARSEREAGWHYCALGPTTRDALRRMGKAVYACASEPDYDRFLEELSP